MVKYGTDKVSVIVPVFNSEITIEKCLNSIRKQTYKNIEIIVINDGSTDGSLEKIEKLEMEDARIKTINQKNGGVSRARNVGLDYAEGDYIAFVDADDYVEENYIEILYDALMKHRADISICWMQGEFPDGRKQADREKRPSVEECFSILEYNYTTNKHRRAVWGALYKVSVTKGIRFAADLYVGEDTLFFAMVAKQCERIVHTYSKLYHYVQYEESAYYGEFTRKKYTELEAWRRVCHVFEDIPSVYVSAKCEYAKVCYEMMVRNYGNELFRKEYYKETLKEYRRSVKFYFRDENTIVLKKIYRMLIAVFPKFFIKYWKPQFRRKQE